MKKKPRKTIYICTSTVDETFSIKMNIKIEEFIANDAIIESLVTKYFDIDGENYYPTNIS